MKKLKFDRLILTGYILYLHTIYKQEIYGGN